MCVNISIKLPQGTLHLPYIFWLNLPYFLSGAKISFTDGKSYQSFFSSIIAHNLKKKEVKNIVADNEIWRLIFFLVFLQIICFPFY